MKKIILIFGTVCILAFTTSCGYRFSMGGDLPLNITKVSVGVFKNNSSQTGAEDSFTTALINELVQTTNADIVDQKNADAFIKGYIDSITFGTLTRASNDSVNSIRVSAVVDLKIIDRTGKVIWSVHNFSDYEDYSFANTNVLDQAAREKAIDKIAERIAEKIVGRMRDNF